MLRELQVGSRVDPRGTIRQEYKEEPEHNVLSKSNRIVL